MDALDGLGLDAGMGRVRARFGAGKAHDQEGGQGAEPDAGQDDVQGIGQDGGDRQFFGRGVAGERAYGEGQGGDGGAQDVAPARARGVRCVAE